MEQREKEHILLDSVTDAMSVLKAPPTFWYDTVQQEEKDVASAWNGVVKAIVVYSPKVGEWFEKAKRSTLSPCDWRCECQMFKYGVMWDNNTMFMRGLLTRFLCIDGDYIEHLQCVDTDNNTSVTLAKNEEVSTLRHYITLWQIGWLLMLIAFVSMTIAFFIK